MACFLKLLSCIIIVMTFCTCSPQKKNPFEFKHHTVSTDLPEEGYNRFGTPAIADFDNDGDQDFALSVTQKNVYWFEMTEPYQWVKHKAGEIQSFADI